MLIDCERCPVRGHGCEDCVVTVLLGPPADGGVEFDPAEQVAFARLADAGLIPPLAPTARRQRGLRVIQNGMPDSVQEIA